MKGIIGLALFIPEIRQMVQEKKYGELKELVNELNVMDFADGWQELVGPEKQVIFRLLSQKKSIELFEYLDFEEQSYLIKNLDSGYIGEILNEMSPDDRADLFSDLPSGMVKKLFEVMKKEEVDEVKELLSYPESAAGGIMTTDFVELKGDLTARQAILKIQQSYSKNRIEPVYATYVTDSRHRLIGGISLQTLITAPPDAKLSNIMSLVRMIKVNVMQDQEEVAKVFAKYDLTVAPVVDDKNVLKGVITVDDIVDVIHQEATEDISRMAGTDVEEFETKSVFKIVQMRLPWLFASWVGGLLSFFVIGHFEYTLNQALALAAFIPVIIGMGGNIGTQSAIIVVRGLALGSIDIKKLWSSVFKEIRIGFILGLFYGVLLGMVAHLKYGSEVRYNLIGLVVGLGICSSMTVAAMMGALIPMIFKKINIDPAVATGPFVTTSVDIGGTLVYFLLATKIML